MMNRTLSIIAFSLTVIPVFILPLAEIDKSVFLVVSVLLLGLSIYIYLTRPPLFPAALFFTLVFISRPVNHWFTELIQVDFPGTFYLIPIVLFTLLVITLPGLRKHISWWQRDKIDRTSWMIIVGLSVLSGLALYIWSRTTPKDLSEFTGLLPELPPGWMLINGIVFALLNSIAEEYLSRGMLCNGLEKLFMDQRLIITLQALIFSIFHIEGFPGDLSGTALVFIWSVALGIIRYRTKGLAGVLIGHFFADLTIYFILYGLK